jgi:tetratricopeptide (TPR) repeat protein
VDLFEKNQAAQAIPHFERATELDPANAQYWKVLGAAYAKQEDYRAAIAPFRRACTLNPRLTDACYYLGRACYAADLYTDALPPLLQALELDSQKARAETALGQAHEALGHPGEAERYFQSALNRRDAFEQSARLAYGLFLVRQARAPEAVAILQAAQRPESAESRYQLGLALSQADRLTDAIAALQRAVALDPNHEAAFLLLGKLKARAQQPPPNDPPPHP